MLRSILAVVGFPLLVLNFSAGVCGTVWLLSLGQYKAAGLGLIALLVGQFVVGVFLMPRLILLAPLISNRDPEVNFIEYVALFVLSIVYTYFVMGAFSVGAFLIFWKLGSSSDDIIPLILLSYAVSTATWNDLAQQEATDRKDSSVVSAFFNQIGCIALAIYIYNHAAHPRWQEMIIWYGVPMTLSLIIHTFAAYTTLSRTHNSGS